MEANKASKGGAAGAAITVGAAEDGGVAGAGEAALILEVAEGPRLKLRDVWMNLASLSLFEVQP